MVRLRGFTSLTGIKDKQTNKQTKSTTQALISLTELQFMFPKIHLKHDVFQQC